MASALSEQAFQIEIEDGLKYDIRIQNSALDSGQFYSGGDRSDILTSDDIDDMIIRHNGGRRSICVCGEADSMSETQGSIDLVDDVKDARICSLTWKASMQPGGQNEFKKINHDKRYSVDIGNWNQTGAMGMIPVTVNDLSS